MGRFGVPAPGAQARGSPLLGVVAPVAADSEHPSLTARSLPGAQGPEDGGTYGLARKEAQSQWGRWLGGAFEWDWFFTGTFADPKDGRLGHTSVGWSLSNRRWHDWIGQLEARSPPGSIYWARAREPHKHRASTHFHALIGGVGNLRRSRAHGDWFAANGMARIEPIKGGAAEYVSKYILKDQGELTFSTNAGFFVNRGWRDDLSASEVVG